MSMPVYIVDEMAAVVAKVNTALTGKSFGHRPIYYMYGHPKEISSRLQALSNSPTEGHKKFPLVILFTDITIDHDTPGFYGAARLRMLVANITDPNYISDQRTELNFKPVLHPIKDELINQIAVHNQFTYEDELKYQETDMYFYGSQQNDKNIFNDYIDAIELRDIRINIKNKLC
jgi:hypothetical protein